MSLNPLARDPLIDNLAVRDSFIDAYASAMRAIIVKDEIFCKAIISTINDPIQFDTMLDTVIDKVEEVDVFKKWKLLFKI